MKAWLANFSNSEATYIVVSELNLSTKELVNKLNGSLRGDTIYLHPLQDIEDISQVKTSLFHQLLKL